MRKYIDILYKLNPVWGQNMIISIYGYLLVKKRYGKVYKNTFNELIRKDYSNFEIEKSYQEKEFLKFINYSTTNSKFYKEFYKNIDLSLINSIEDIVKLPILKKEDLRKNLDQVYTVKSKEAIVSFTGGTTGKSLKVLFTLEDFQKRMAYLDAFKYRLGVKDSFKIKKATFSGRSIIYGKPKRVFWRNNYAYNQRLYSTFHLNEKSLPYYIENLNNYQPEILNGFVSALTELANYIKRKNIKIHSPQMIFTTSETLLIEHRTLLKEVFKCPVYDQYASSEGAPFITECIKGNLHYNIDTGIIETDENNNMIITSFTTHGTPLIRYNIEDIINFKEGKCECGSSHPLVKNIEGRKVDFLYNNSKEKISLSHLADVIKGNPSSIIKMQFHQEDYNKITVLIVVDQKIFKQKHLQLIIESMQYRFGKDTNIELKIVDEILREKSGKYKLIKNKLT